MHHLVICMGNRNVFVYLNINYYETVCNICFLVFSNLKIRTIIISGKSRMSGSVVDWFYQVSRVRACIGGDNRTLIKHIKSIKSFYTTIYTAAVESVKEITTDIQKEEENSL